MEDKRVKKDFLLRWNPTISSMTLDKYQKALSEFPDGFCMDWSIYDWKQAHEGDRFFMLRTGDENAGIIFRGVFVSEPYEDEDWAGTSKRKHYISIDCYDAVPADKKPMLGVETLERHIPEINWRSGHSGELLSPDVVMKLVNLYTEFVELEIDDDDEEEKDFDNNPSHGDHWECVCDSSDLENTIIVFAKILTKRGSPDLHGNTDDFDEKGNVVNVPTIGVKYVKEGVGIQGIILCHTEENELRSLFPAFYDGTAIELELTKIDEFSNGVEAVLTGENEHGELRFHNIDYYAWRNKYNIGEKYTFQIAALAYKAEVVSEEGREFEICGDDAIKFYTELGNEVEYLEDGSVKPIKFGAAELVALLQNDDAYPSDGEFQSPIQGRVSTKDFFGCPLYRIPILVLRDVESEGTEIPLYAKSNFFDHKPRSGEPVRGYLWLTGRLEKDELS